MKYKFDFLEVCDFSQVPKSTCEDSKTIALGKQHRKKIETSFLVPSEVIYVNDTVGHGLKTSVPIEAGSYVGEYTGVVRKNERDYFAPLNDYLYAYPLEDEMGRNYVIDATQGHYTRFINHSYEPNLAQFYAFFDGYYHLIFIAKRDIEAGEQLFYNYGQSYWAIRAQPKEIARN